MSVYLQVAVALAVTYATYLAFKLLRAIARVRNWPGIRQLVPTDSLLLTFGLIPRWLAPVQRDFSYANRWANLYKKFGRDVVTIVSPSSTYFFVADADVAKEITTTRVEHFPKPIHQYGTINIFGLNVVSTEGQEWKRHRKIASAGFSERNNRLVFQETIKVVSDMVKELKDKHASGGAVIDIAPYMLKVALSVISSASFGIDADWNNHDALLPGRKMTFFEALETITSNPIPFLLLPRWALSIPIFNFRKLKDSVAEYTRCVDERLAVVRKAESSQSEERGRGDLFSTLVRNANGAKGEELSLSETELFGNIYVLMLAGHETSAHTLSFAFGLLALHPEIQEEFYREIKEVMGGKEELTYEDFLKLKLGLAIMNETLRLYPIVPAIPKWALKDTTMDNGKIFVPAGSYVTLHVSGLHYNEKYWGADATSFRPSRFLEDYNKDAFIPFSDGSRSCMGKRFAQIESVIALATLVRHFRISTEAKDKESLFELMTILTLLPKNPVMLKFTPRV